MTVASMPLADSTRGVVVRSADGTFKIWEDGQWQVLNIQLPAAGPAAAAPLTPQAPTFAGPQAAAYFSAAEEQEARRLAQRLDTAPSHKRFSLTKILNQVQSRLLKPPAGPAETNLRQTVFTFLRGTRHAVDFGAVLMRAVDQGGVGLTAEEAQNMVMILTAINSKIHQEGGEVIDDLKVAPPADLNRPVLNKQSLTPPPPVPVRFAPPVAPPPPLPKIAPRPEPKPVKVPMPPPLPVANYPVRPKLADVKVPTKDSRRLVGPIEELRMLDIPTFRTLGPTPADQAEQMVIKIQSLGKDSLSRRAEGIAAWRQSEVYQVYREIGLASIQSGQSVAQVAANRFRSGLPTLTEAEFNAIADGNKKLRY